MCSPHTPTSPGNNTLSNNLHNNPFLPGFSSSPGWLLVTRTRGAWWCRYRGHWRSGPESVHKNGILKTFTHISIHIPMHTPQQTKNKNKKTIAKPSTHQTSDTWSLMMSLWRTLQVRSRVCAQEWHFKDIHSHIYSHTHAYSSTNKKQKQKNYCKTLNSPNIGHVEPDDVVMADIAGQALDIFLHGPESAHKNGIVKTKVHSHIHSHPPMHTPKTN